MNFDKLNKNIVYCKHCFYENEKLTPLKFNNNYYEICSKHSYLKGNFRTLRFDEKLNEWKSIRGLQKELIYRIPVIFHHICDKCGYIEDNTTTNTLWKCPKCNWIPENSILLKNHKEYKYEHICHNKDCEFYNVKITNNIMPMNYICKCGQKEMYYYCKRCGYKLNSPLQKCQNCNFDIHKNIYFCKNCGNNINNPYQKCNKCGYQKEIIITCPNCKTKFNLLNKCQKCNFHPLFEHRSNLAKENLKKLNKSIFKIFNGKLYYFNNEEYILWNKFQQNFKNQYNNFNIENFKDLKEFKLYLTFRSQDSKDWSNARIVFEQSLIDENIGWFVYIKFYICGKEDDNFKPLVIGKTGSLLVNNSGSDLSFSTNINDGPARRFLAENNYQWCKTHIAILRCNSEKEAYKKEKYYSIKLNLFGS